MDEVYSAETIALSKIDKGSGTKSWLSQLLSDQVGLLRRNYDLAADAAQTKASIFRLIMTWTTIALVPYLLAQTILLLVGEKQQFDEWFTMVVLLSPLSYYLGKKFDINFLVSISPHLFLLGFVGLSALDVINYSSGTQVMMYWTLTLLITGFILPAWMIYVYLFIIYVSGLMVSEYAGYTPADQVFILIALGVGATIIFLIAFFIESLINAKEEQGVYLKMLYENNDRVLKEVAHKLKTPVTTLRLELEHEDDGGKIETARIKGFLGDITNGIDTLIRLSKIDMSNTQPIARAVTLQEVFTPIIRDAEILAENYEKLNELKRSINLLLPDKLKDKEITISVERVRESILNVIDNSIRHNLERGIVNINIKVVRIRGYYKLTISDDGVGIPEDRLEKLTSASTENLSNGAHIGLAISRNIIRSSGGKFEISSKVGKGTTVEILLPI